MCHHGDADEGWRHPDLSAVLSAGSSDTIRIHQQRRSVTFQLLGTLWGKIVGAAEKHNLFLKAKLRHPLGVRQATHFSLQHKENTKWPAGFSPSPQRESLSLALFSKLASTSSEKSPCCSSADCRRITKDKFIFSLLRLIRKEQKFLHSNEVVTAESETCRVQAPPPDVTSTWRQSINQ